MTFAFAGFYHVSTNSPVWHMVAGEQLGTLQTGRL